MTPQERKLVDDLFERLATLERNPREPDAEQAIMAGLRRAPNAAYALVQTVLLQDEALRQANERIRELEEGTSPQQQAGGGFLDSMRGAVFGGGNTRSSVPQTGGDRPMGVPAGFPRAGERYEPQAAYPQQAPEPQRGGGFGGSFLGTAAAAAAGMIGGTLLMNSLKGAFGGDQAHTKALGDFGSQSHANPWGESTGGGDLARQAGLDGIGRPGGEGQRAGLYQDSHEPTDEGDFSAQDDGLDLDFDTDLT